MKKKITESHQKGLDWCLAIGINKINLLILILFIMVSNILNAQNAGVFKNFRDSLNLQYETNYKRKVLTCIVLGEDSIPKQEYVFNLSDSLDYLEYLPNIPEDWFWDKVLISKKYDPKGVLIEEKKYNLTYDFQSKAIRSIPFYIFDKKRRKRYRYLSVSYDAITGEYFFYKFK